MRIVLLDVGLNGEGIGTVAHPLTGENLSCPPLSLMFIYSQVQAPVIHPHCILGSPKVVRAGGCRGEAGLHPPM
ncbi:hypothetical protein SDC9_68077 [bioreactor metagenome]|uniref:Uncharacterized protein n=1 Tax=bioreactor metagenome TaxID=1076179 RepID=A0A644Y4Z4_9ZZZZ